MMFTFIQPVSASNTGINESMEKARVTMDSAGKRVAVSEDQSYIYVSSFDKISNTLSIEYRDKKTNEVVSTQFLDLREREKENGNMEERTVARGSYSQNTYSNYEYTIWYGQPNKWELRISRDGLNAWYYNTVYETSSNRSDIERFRDKVEDINSQEYKIMAAVGAASLATVLTIGLSGTPGSIASALTAIGFGTAVINLVIEINRMWGDARYYFYRIQNS